MADPSHGEFYSVTCTYEQIPNKDDWRVEDKGTLTKVPGGRVRGEGVQLTPRKKASGAMLISIDVTLELKAGEDVNDLLSRAIRQCDKELKKHYPKACILR